MTLLDATATAQDFDTLGGPLVDEFERTLTGKSPYLGTLPWLLSFEVHEERVGGCWVTTLREEDGTVLVQVENESMCPTGVALLQYVDELLELKPPHQLRSAKEMRERLAETGYRLVPNPTGRRLGHTSTHVIVADSISQLDAALQLRADPELIYDLLDAGADPMRHHVKYGQPYQVALALAGTRPEYLEVVYYMRATHGAH